MGYFELKKSNNTLLTQQYYFVLKASNGQTIAQSEMYTTKEGALNGINSVKANAATAAIHDHSSVNLLF